jgi:response regulator NasT
MANIVVAFPKTEDAVSIKNLLVRNGYPVTAVCTSGTNVLSVADDFGDGIIICGYKLNDMLFSELRENLPKEFEMLLLASAQKIHEFDCDGVIAVTMPLKAGDFINTVEMLSMNIARRRRKQKNTLKKRSEEEERILRQAKEILMEKHHMSEAEAHRYIQKTSMDSGTNIIETSRMVISIMLK